MLYIFLRCSLATGVTTTRQRDQERELSRANESRERHQRSSDRIHGARGCCRAGDVQQEGRAEAGEVPAAASGHQDGHGHRAVHGGERRRRGGRDRRRGRRRRDARQDRAQQAAAEAGGSGRRRGGRRRLRRAAAGAGAARQRAEAPARQEAAGRGCGRKAPGPVVAGAAEHPGGMLLARRAYVCAVVCISCIAIFRQIFGLFFLGRNLPIDWAKMSARSMGCIPNLKCHVF